jgi:hypothetical protein
MERATLRCADALVTVTEGWRRRLRNLYPSLPCYTIPNGHDGIVVVPPAEGGLSEDGFRITYTGKIDLTQQDPAPLIEGLNKWLDGDPDAAATVRVSFHTYGDGAAVLERRIRESAPRQLVFADTLDHRSSLDAQRRSSVLVLFAWQSDPDWVPAKLFEYLAARRPILVLGSPDTEASRIVLEAGAGAVATNADEVHRVLAAWYSAWKIGATLPQASPAAIEAHDFRHRADEYDALLQDLLQRSRE